MKITSLLFSVFLSLYSIKGQDINFTQVFPLPPAPQVEYNFTNVQYSAIDSVDLDNDGDLDVVISGATDSQYEVIIYINNGTGDFTEVSGGPFEGVRLGDVACADVDGDNDFDVIVVGENASGTCSSKLYTNDGSGNFTEVLGTPFEGVRHCSIEFSDIENDGDQDLLITGETSSNLGVSILYSNNGSGVFTEVIGTPFEAVRKSSIIFIDVENDTDQDVVITGENNSGQNITKLYSNDGSGNFTEVLGTPFEGVTQSAIAHSDINNDNDQDLIISGLNNFAQNVTILYENDGLGVFTEVVGTTLDSVKLGEVSFADIDNDGDSDLLISGRNNQAQLISIIYINDGLGNFSEATGITLIGCEYGSNIFTDLDNDNDLDIVISGRGASFQTVTAIYINDGVGNFINTKGSVFNDLHYSSIGFSDIDNDSDFDVLVAGQLTSGGSLSTLYLNDGAGNYSEITGTPFQGVAYGTIDFADTDGDGDEDVFITGNAGTLSPISVLYNNDGNGVFTEVTGTPFDSVYYGDSEFADIDGDNDLDLLLTGYTLTGGVTKMYRNDGNNSFVELIGTPFGSVIYGSVAFADVDNDGDMDVLITGDNGPIISKLYLNDGAGVFAEVSGTPFEGVRFSSVAFSDVDNDNDLDVFLSGRNGSSQAVSKLYTNDGNGVFMEDLISTFEVLWRSSNAFSDIDGDGDQDLLITGANLIGGPESKLYLNDGTGVFSFIINDTINPISDGAIMFKDIDGDNDDDLLVSGITTGEIVTRLFRNNSCSQKYGTDIQVACDSYTWIDGNIYTSDNSIATHNLINGSFGGCDSLVTLNLNMYSGSSSIDIITSCDSLVWIDGNTYSSNNNTATYAISGGCNVTLDLTIVSSSIGIDTRVECGAHTWIDGNTYTSSNNTATFNIVNGSVNGCDSLVNLDLTILEKPQTIDTIIACGSYTWIDGVTYSSVNNSASHIIANGATNGCDSLVYLDILILPITQGTDYYNACSPFIWIDGNTYTESNNSATHILTNSYGCDSIVTLDLVVLNNAGDTSATVCESFDWNGSSYTASGTPTQTLTNVFGCDSVVTLHLTILNVDTAVTQSLLMLSALESGASYQWLYCDSSFTEIQGENSQFFIAPFDGNYAVEVNDGQCIDTSYCHNISTVGVIESEFSKNIEIFPNPTKDNFQIDMGMHYSEIKVTMYNVLGSIVAKKVFVNSRLLLIDADVPAGVYFVGVSFDDKDAIFKLTMD